MKSNVLFVCPDLEMPGGVASYCRLTLPYLQGVDSHTIGSRAEYPATILSTAWRLVRDYGSFLRKLMTRRYRLVHLNPSLGVRSLLRDGILLLLARAMRCKVVVFIHGWDPECERKIRAKYQWLFRATFLKADCIIVLASEFQAKLIEMGYTGPVRLQVTNVERSVFDDQSYTRQFSGDRLNILYLSRIEQDKGIYEALQTFQRLALPNSRLVVAGNGSELPAVRRYTEELGLENVEFKGYVAGAAKRQVFLEADLFLFPTRYGEGLPIGVLEAMAYGLPVVTRPVGGIRDFFADGLMGRLTDSCEPSVFAELINTLTAPETRATISAFNRAYAAEHFRCDRVAQRLQEVYGEFI